MPVKGLERTSLLALGVVVLYLLVLRYQHELGLTPARGIRPCRDLHDL
jgi:hypothetical protein